MTFNGWRGVGLHRILAILLLAAPALSALPTATLAADDPEAVYAKFHKASLEANFEEMRKWGSAAGSAELEAMWSLKRWALLKFLSIALPKTYTVTSKTIDPDGNRATLKLSFKQEDGTAYGTATLVREGGGWKVDNTAWGEPAPTATKPAAQVQASAASISDDAAKGSVHGAAFRVEKATLKNGILKLRQGKDFFADYEFSIFLFLKGADSLDGKKYVIDGKNFGNPHIHMSYKVEGRGVPTTELFMDGYRMTLEFGKRSGNAIPGTIDLHMPDAAKSHVTGSFEAKIE